MRVEVSVAMEKGGVWSGKEVDWDASARMDYSAMNCRSTGERRKGRRRRRCDGNGNDGSCSHSLSVNRS